jgi:tRNA threonylcarbamoyladenosine biosynthesis protein TsaE
VQNLVLSLPNPTATLDLGKILGRSLPAGSVLLLKGDLGSGKTTLTQGLGQGLGIVEAISSPTFILLNEYPEGRISLYHLDLYRLQPQDVEALYLETYWDGLEVPLGIVAIEWAERLLHLPKHYLEIHLSAVSTGGRRVEIRPVGKKAEVWLESVKAQIDTDLAQV